MSCTRCYNIVLIVHELIVRIPLMYVTNGKCNNSYNYFPTSAIAKLCCLVTEVCE